MNGVCSPTCQLQGKGYLDTIFFKINFLHKSKPLSLILMDLPTQYCSNVWVSLPVHCTIPHPAWETGEGKKLHVSLYKTPRPLMSGWTAIERPFNLSVSHGQWLSAGRKDTSSVFSVMSALMMWPRPPPLRLGRSPMLFPVYTSVDDSSHRRSAFLPFLFVQSWWPGSMESTEQSLVPLWTFG